MSNLQVAALFATLAGAMIPIGAIAARVEHICPGWLEDELRHGVVAFGGGALLAAVAFVLVPEGISHLSPASSVAAMVFGGIAFSWLDRLIETHAGAAGQLIAMVADFVPEALALGAMFASDATAGTLLAILIGLQNLPEGFNAYRELAAWSRYSSARILGVFFALVVLGPLAATLGNLYLTGHPELLGLVMLFAAGGILYLIFQDIAPQAHLDKRWAPPLGAVGGFTLGLLGHMLIG